MKIVNVKKWWTKFGSRIHANCYPINPHQDVNQQRSFFPLKRAYMVILRWVQRQYFETIQAVLPANPLWSHGEQNVYQA
jgi:hypothetical protein